MADQFAIVRGTVPGSTGTVTYTSTDITDCQGAIVIVCGDISGESSVSNSLTSGDEGAMYSISFVGSNNTPVDLGAVMTAVASDGAVFDPDELTNRQNFNEGDASTSTPLAVRLFYNSTGSTPPTELEAEYDGITGGSDGIQLNWTSVEDGSLGSYRITVVLLGGFTNLLVDTGTPTATGFEGDCLLMLSRATTTAIGSDFIMSFGAAINDDPTYTQASASVNFPRRTGGATTDAYAITRNNRAITRCGDNTEAANVEVTAFSGTGFTETTTGTASRAYMIMEFSDSERTSAVATETITTSTGSVAFTGLGIRPMLLVGIITGNTSENVVQGSSSAVSKVCFFVSLGPDETYSITCAYEHDVGSSMVARAFSGDDLDGISLLADTGDAVSFQAEMESFDASGFTLDVTTGFNGRMTVWAASGVSLNKAVDEGVDISEAAQHILNLHRAVDDDIEITETTGELQVERTFVTEEGYDSAMGGTQADDSAQGGSVASDDAGV